MLTNINIGDVLSYVNMKYMLTYDNIVSEKKAFR